jgi:DNA-binding NarL/FixJ family response regulator
MTKLNGRRAIVFDGHPLWLDAMKRLLGSAGVDVVAAATDPLEVLELVQGANPDLLVVGLGKGAGDAAILEATRVVRRVYPAVKVVMLAPGADDLAIEAAFSMGVSAYCMKSAEPDDLLVAVRQSFEQSIYLGALRRVPAPAEELPATWDGSADKPELTKREVEILRLVAEGKSNSQVARSLWVTEQTVKFHLSNIYRKLDVANRTEAARWAQLNGLLEPAEVSLTESVA